MSRQQVPTKRRQHRTPRESSLQRNGLNDAMKKLGHLEQRLQNSEATVTPNLPTPTMTMKDMPEMTTNTLLAETPQANPNQQNPDQTILPRPSILISERSESPKNTKKANATKKLTEEVEVPSALSPSHERKAQQLAATYSSLGMLLLGFQPTAGKIVILTSVDRAREVLRVARHHPQLMKVVDSIIEGNDYIGLAVGHLSMLGMIFALQERLPENGFTQGLKIQGMVLMQQWDVIQGAMNVHPDASGFTTESSH